jgi:hypothetical protein
MVLIRVKLCACLYLLKWLRVNNYGVYVKLIASLNLNLNLNLNLLKLTTDHCPLKFTLLQLIISKINIQASFTPPKTYLQTY